MNIPASDDSHIQCIWLGMKIGIEIGIEVIGIEAEAEIETPNHNFRYRHIVWI